MTSKEKITDILDFVQNVTDADWGFMQCLKQDLEQIGRASCRERVLVFV